MDIRKKIIELIALDSNIEGLNQYLIQDVDLSKLGLNSLSFIKLITSLEEEYGIEFEDEALDLNKFTSLSSLCSYVEDYIKMGSL